MSARTSDASHWDYHTDDCEATKARIDGMQNWPSACNCKGRQGSSKESNDLVPAWGPEPLIERLRTCRFMLYQHGILTDVQSDRCEEKINKKAITNEGK